MHVPATARRHREPCVYVQACTYVRRQDGNESKDGEDEVEARQRGHDHELQHLLVRVGARVRVVVRSER